MKKALLLLSAIISAAASLATPSITGVTAKQRFPWNGKVDITYTLAGEVETLMPDGISVKATDNASGTTYTAASSALSGETGTAAGAHHVVWDLNAQGVEFKSDDVVFTVTYTEKPKPYCVIDLSAGVNASSYPVAYLDAPPSGGFNVDAYKTTKLVLKLIEAGTFIKGKDQSDESHRVTLTKPFFIGIFEVTQKQWSLVTGSNPSCFSGDKHPVEEVSYNDIRGASAGAQWPASSAVDLSSFLGKLRSRTGLDFDLPTTAQWEYACRAGTTTTFSYGNFADGNYMWYSSNSDSQTHDVGTKQPNPWELYDMHGNVSELCLDWAGGRYGVDPPGASLGSYRVDRGSSWIEDGTGSSSYAGSSLQPHHVSRAVGFRLAKNLNQ